MSTKPPTEGVDRDKDDLMPVLRDFVQDMLTTFPEIKGDLDPRLGRLAGSTPGDDCQDDLEGVRADLSEVYPTKFFEILYQKEEMFSQPEELCLLPGIDFRPLWKSNITAATRKTMWKYLQLVLFTLIGSMKDGASFGDTAALFEAVDPEHFRGKLEETIKEMQACFEEGGDGDANGEGDSAKEGSIPNPETLHEHMREIMGGKLGQLAHEIAEEAANDLGMSAGDPGKATQNAFETLLKDPMKLIKLVQKVGGKLNQKIKSGEIKEAELLKEATDIVHRMRDMPGMGGIEKFLGKAGKGKIDLSAMEAHLQRSSKMASQRDRMRAKLAERKKKGDEAPAPAGKVSDKVGGETEGRKKRRRKKKKRAK